MLVNAANRWKACLVGMQVIKITQTISRSNEFPNMKHLKLFLALLSSVAFLTACGGGGSTSTTSPVNNAPVAIAGADQSVVTNSVVTINGSSSTDADSDSLTYDWTLTSKPIGSTATLSSAVSKTPTFVADAAGTYVASLVVSDGKVSSTASTVSISASNVSAQGNIRSLLGRVTLQYKFSSGTNTYTDAVNFTAANLSADGTSLTAMVSATRAISCSTFASSTVIPYSYLCAISSGTFPDLFLFNISQGKISGVYEFCTSTTATCSASIVLSPDGTVTGTVVALAAGVEVIPVVNNGDDVSARVAIKAAQLDSTADSQTVSAAQQVAIDELARTLNITTK